MYFTLASDNKIVFSEAMFNVRTAVSARLEF